jgi:M6 family metalloprotease-like protein
VPPLHPELYHGLKPCHTRRITARDIQRYGSAHMAVIGSASGDKNIAVIIVAFPTAGARTSGHNTIENLGNFDGYFNSMKSYFLEVSFGLLKLHPSFFGAGTAAPGGESTAAAVGSAYVMPQPMQYYGCGDTGSGCTGSANNELGDYLIRDALIAARVGRGGTLTSSNFDAVLVMHAGVGNETSDDRFSSYPGNIWSAMYQQPDVIGAAGGGFEDGAVFPELESGTTSPLGVICHEFGHILTLPDIYNTRGGEVVVGDWELMDRGPYVSDGTNPSHPGAWCKNNLGWSTPRIAVSSGAYSLNSISAGLDRTAVLQLPIQGSAKEYFLLEYRSKTDSTAQFDKGIPGTGILVWHIDDAINDARGFAATDPSLNDTLNWGTPHYGVSLVTADGYTFSDTNRGRASNAFTDRDFTEHQSDDFGGHSSGISVVKITGVGGPSVNFEVVNLASTASQTILKLINYPNPAGKGYAPTRGEGYTTIQFQVGRSASDRQLNIYTLSGDLVRKIDKNSISLNTARSSDLKWVYEYDWDLKNGDGRMVAPGVYLYLIRVDGHTKSGKAVIIR